jgi:hypothetical protein
MKLSEKGKDWIGDPLTEDNLSSGVAVRYRGKSFVTGNRRNDSVDLYYYGLFFGTVKMNAIRLIK